MLKKKNMLVLSHIWLFVTVWTVAHLALLSMAYSSFPDENTGMGFHALLQGIFLI